MKLFKRLRDLAEGHHEATRENQRVIKQAEREGEVADALLKQAEAQAESLRDRNHHNHYSERLTESFRGRLA
ncbi:hypothetical protein FDH86_gp038 [Arthrobacter phage Tank]|uniref:Uncharacterized protein n=2 Tax=Tankvirus tank TaxID=1982567 RepID=A0A0U4B749_9CAUD|nr:hypothetical protein FDH86_gp038 [Arthrobacter phage Tank]ALY10573.1 hypothetical protein TANK_38 [Arthrobacter phage Tank]ALY10822.1 hypothetical protein WILDE_38 [Arthrobacter phage Wilde]